MASGMTVPATEANETAAAAEVGETLGLLASGLGVVETETMTAPSSESESMVTWG